MEQEVKEQRNWSELNVDILIMIFQTVGIIDVLKSVGFVCRAWRKVTKDEPEIFRRIDMTNHNYVHDGVMLTNLARMAIYRSGDGLEEFWIENFGDDDLLHYLSYRTNVLKSLRLITSSGISDEGLINLIKKQPFLEDLQITFGSFSTELPKLVGREVPNLKHFKLNLMWVLLPPQPAEIVDNEQVLGIAKTMHQLRSLQLIGNKLRNKGLHAILEGCPHLETLDIRRCYNVNMNSDMWVRCARLTTLRLPDDPLDDYEFPAERRPSLSDFIRLYFRPNDYDDG